MSTEYNLLRKELNNFMVLMSNDQLDVKQSLVNCVSTIIFAGYILSDAFNILILYTTLMVCILK